MRLNSSAMLMIRHSRSPVHGCQYWIFIPRRFWGRTGIWETAVAVAGMGEGLGCGVESGVFVAGISVGVSFTGTGCGGRQAHSISTRLARSIDLKLIVFGWGFIVY